MGNCNLASGALILPEYEEVRRDLIARGHGADWVFQIVDPDYPCSVFLKSGGHWYKSSCPSYEGYWLNGSIGAVQCKNAPGLLPGIHHHLFCKSEEGCEKCPCNNHEVDRHE